MIPLHRVKPNGKVDLWDMGPSRPMPPKAPDTVDAKLKDAERMIAEVEYEHALEAYKNAVRHYGEAKREFDRWHASNGGPVKVELWGVDARHAMQTEPKRYVINLPKGTKPGQAQIEADARAESANADLAAARASDPEFGRKAS